jgi:hypothetical protein
MQGQNQLKGLEMQGNTQRDIAKETHGYQRDQVQLQREQLAQQRADSLRQQAQQAYASGDIQRGQMLEQQAQQSMGGLMGGAGAAATQANPTGGGLLGTPQNGMPRTPAAARPAIDAIIGATRNNPDQMVQRLRQLGMSDEQINLELANAFGREGVFNHRYGRTAQNPHGSHFTAVDPVTGRPHFTLPIVGGLIPGMAR